ncbi:hypothetical protein C6341_g9340 [Phytophthora cactorum]|nr:hypothetical protein C6341_g9340 [Phytophthora cactorum]
MQDHLRFGAPPKLRPRTAGSSRTSLPPPAYDLTTTSTCTSRPERLASTVNARKESPSLLLRQRLQSPRPGSAAPQQTPRAPGAASSSDEKGVFMKPPMRPKSANAASRQVSRHRMQLVQNPATLLSSNQQEDDTEWIDQRDPDALLTSSKEDAVRPGLASTVVKPSHYARAASGVKRPHSAAASTRYQPFRAREKSTWSLASCLSVVSRSTKAARSMSASSRPVSSRDDRLLASTRDHSDNTFVYAVPRHFLGHGLPYDPYDIVPVTHAPLFGGGSISQMKDALWDYYTISKSGYTFHLKSDGFRSTFLSLSNWEAQKEIFTKLRSLSTFSRFRYRKVFVAWRQWVQHNKREAARENLFLECYFSYPVLLNGMQEIRVELSRLSNQQLMWDFNGETSSLENFTTANVKFLKTRTRELRQITARIQTIMANICRVFLGDMAPLHAGFPGHEFALSVRKSSNYHILESYVKCEQGLASAHQQFLQHKHFRSARLPTSEAAEARNALMLSSLPEHAQTKRTEKPSRHSGELEDIRWTMASIKRRKCKQLTKFVTLVDFLLLDAFSEVVKRSLDLFHAFVLRGANAATITRLTDHDDLTLAMHQTVNVARQSVSQSIGEGSTDPSQRRQRVPLTRQHIKAILHAAWKGKLGMNTTEEITVSTLSIASMESKLETLFFDGLSKKSGSNADTFSVDDLFFVAENALSQLLVLPSFTASSTSIFTTENGASKVNNCEISTGKLSFVEQEVLAIPCFGSKPLFTLDVATSAIAEKRGRQRYQVCFNPELTVLVRILQDIITGFTEAFREVPPLLSNPELRSVLAFADDIRALNLHSTVGFSASSRSVVSTSRPERDERKNVSDDDERFQCPANRLLERMEKDVNYLSVRDDVQELVRTALHGADELAASYSQVLELRQHNESINFELKARLFRRNEYTLDEMKNDANNFTNQLSALETLKMSTNVAFLHFSLQQLQAELLPSPARCLDAMRDLLPRLARERCDQFLQYITTSSSKIEKPMTQDLDAFTTYLLNLREVYNEIHDKELELTFLHDFFTVLDTLKFPAPVETFKAFVLCDPEFHALKSHVLEACTNRDTDLQSYTPLLTENLAKLTRRTNTLQSSASDQAMAAQSSTCQDARENVVKLYQEAEKMQLEARRLVRIQQVFEESSTGVRPPSKKFEDLHELAAELKLKSELWEAVCEADGHLSACSTESIRSVDLDKMNEVASHVDLVVEKIRQYATQVASSFELERLEKLQATLHGLAPVIRDLRNPHLVERHWSKLEHKMQCSLTPISVETTESTTEVEEIDNVTSTSTSTRLDLQMQQLLDVNVVAHGTAIRHVSEEASAEAAIAGSFLSLVRTWEAQEIPLEARKDRDGRDAHCIGDCSELMLLIEESQVLLRVMDLSTYSLVVQERLPKMIYDLNHTKESLELLLVCQRKWDYTQRLVSIDFARTFPEQAKQLQKHDTSWRSLTLGLFNRSQCLSFGVSAEHRQSLLVILEGFEAAAKILAEHLEIKRQVFPVFFQLSDLELATLLSKCRDVSCIQAFLYQCFDNVGRIVFGTRDGFQDILQVTSRVYGDAETIPMGKNLKARGPVEQWLAAVEKRLAEQLRRSTKQAIELLSRYSTEDGESSILDTSHFSIQSILLADRIVRCTIIENGARDITNSSDGRLANEIKAYSARVNQILPTHNRDISPRDITLRTCLHLQELQFRDAVSSHVAAKQTNLSSSFTSGGLAVDWEYQLKYRMDDATTVGHECHVEMNTLKIPYGFNYLSPHNDIVVTPSSLRSLFALFACIRHAQGCALTGPSESGKRTLSVQVSSILGRRNFNATLTSYTHATRLLIGALYAGGTFCADLQLKLSIQDNAPLIKTLATTLASIEHAVLTKNPVIGVHRSPITFIPGTAMFVVFPSNLVIRDAEEIRIWTEKLSQFAIVQWDRDYIIEALLMSRGFVDPQRVAKQLLILWQHARSNHDLSIGDPSVYESPFSFTALKTVVNDTASLIVFGTDQEWSLREAVLSYFSVRMDDIQLKAIETLIKSIFPSDNKTVLQDILQARSSISPDLHEAISVAAQDLHFIPRKAMLDSVSSLATALTCSVSTVLVGTTGVGKTTSYQVLAKVFELSHQRPNEEDLPPSNDDTITVTSALRAPVKHSKHPSVSIHVVLPMALTASQLYGGVSLDDHGRMPSILGQVIREAQELYTGDGDSKSELFSKFHHQVWVVFDDTLDLRWLEGLLAVLVESRSVSPLLAFEDGEFMTLPPNLRFIFEILQLHDATPSFLHVSAILYLKGDSFTDTQGSKPMYPHDQSRMEISTAYLYRYLILQRERISQSEAPKSQTWSSTDAFNLIERWLINSSLLEELNAVLDAGPGDIHLSQLQRVNNLVSLLQSLVSTASALSDSKLSAYPEFAETISTGQIRVEMALIYSLMWGFVGCTDTAIQRQVSDVLRREFEHLKPAWISCVPHVNLFETLLDLQNLRFVSVVSSTGPVALPPQVSTSNNISSLFIPTSSSLVIHAAIREALRSGRGVLLVGGDNARRTTLARNFLGQFEVIRSIIAAGGVSTMVQVDSDSDKTRKPAVSKANEAATLASVKRLRLRQISLVTLMAMRLQKEKNEGDDSTASNQSIVEAEEGVPLAIAPSIDPLKTAMIRQFDRGDVIPFFFAMPHSNSEAATELANCLERMLQRERTGVFEPPPGKTALLILDDLHLAIPTADYSLKQVNPSVCAYLRSVQEHRTVYRGLNCLPISVENLMLFASINRDRFQNFTTNEQDSVQKLTTQFFPVLTPSCELEELHNIFNQTLQTHWSSTKTSGTLSPAIRYAIPTIVAATTVLWDRLRRAYNFCLQDLARVYEGLAVVGPSVLSDVETLLRLWTHESCRALREPSMGLCSPRQESEIAAEIVRMRSLVSQVTQRRASVRASLALGSGSGLSFAKRQSVQVSPENDENASPATLLALFTARSSAPSDKKLSRPSLQFNSLQEQQHRAVMMGGLWAFVTASIYYAGVPVSLDQLDNNSVSGSGEKSLSTRARRRSSASFMRRKSLQSVADSGSSQVGGRSGKWIYAEISFEDDTEVVSTATIQAYFRDLRTFSSTLRPWGSQKTTALPRDVPLVPFKLALAVLRIDRVLARPAARLVLLDSYCSGTDTLLRYAIASRTPELHEDSAIFTLSGLQDASNITTDVNIFLMQRWKRLLLDLYDRIGVSGQEATLVIKRLDLLPMAIINQIQALMTTGEVPGILSLEEQVHLATRVCDERLLALKSQHAAQVAQIRAEAEASRDQALAMLHQKQRDAPTTPMLEAFQQVETRYQRELRSKLARVDLRYQQDSDDLRRQREVESESVAATVMALTRPLGVTSGKWASAVARMCSKLRTVLLVDKEHEQQVRTASPSIFSTCDVVSVPPLDRESLRTLVYGHFHAQILAQSSKNDGNLVDTLHQLQRSLWGVACMATDMHLAVINALKDEYLPTSRIFAMAEFFGKLFIENVKREEAFRAKTAWFLDLSNRLDRDLGALRSSDKLLTEQLSTIDQQLVYDEEKLVEQKQDAERIRVIMQRFRTAADEQILVTTEAQEQAQKELREPMNCLEEANRALLLVDRRHIVEIKSFVSPPPLVQLVLGAVCVLFQLESSWESARRLLLGDANFVQNLLQFNKDAVSAATLSKLETEYLSDERFRREEVERQSVAAASIVGWVRAIHQYATSRQKVQPTLDKLQKAQGRLQLIMQEFQVSKDRVVEADGTWQTTQAAIDTATTKKEALKDEIASLGARCDSGDRAMEALKEDRKLQNEAASAISMRRGFSLTTWNALLSAGALAYASELSLSSRRDRVFQAWEAAYRSYGGLTPGCPPASTCCTFIPSITVVLKEEEPQSETPLSALFAGDYLPDGSEIEETTKLATSIGDLAFSRRRLWDASLLSLVASTSSLPVVMITRFSCEVEELLVTCARRVWHWPQLHMVYARALDFDDVFKVAARSGHQLLVLDVEPMDSEPRDEENKCLHAALNWNGKFIDGTEHLVVARKLLEDEDSTTTDTIALHPNFRLILTSHASRAAFGEVVDMIPTLDGFLHSSDIVDVMLDKISSETGKFTLKTALKDHALLAQQYEAAQNQLTRLLEAAAVTSQFPLSQTKALRERVTAIQEARQILRDKRREIQEQLRLVNLQCTSIARSGSAVFNAFNATIGGNASPPLTLQVFLPILLDAVSTISPITSGTTGAPVPTTPDVKRSAASRRFGILARTAASLALSSRGQSSSSGVPSEVLSSLLSRIAPLIPTGEWHRYLLQVIVLLEEIQSTKVASVPEEREHRVKIDSNISRSVDTILLQARLKRGLNDTASRLITAETIKAIVISSSRTDLQRRVVSTILNGCKLEHTPLDVQEVDSIVRLAVSGEATRLERLRVSLVLFPELVQHVCGRMLAGYGVPLNFHQRETGKEGFWLQTLRKLPETTAIIVRTRHDFHSFRFAERVFFHGLNGSPSFQIRVLQTLAGRKFRAVKEDKAAEHSVLLTELYVFPRSIDTEEDEEVKPLLLMLKNFNQILEMEKTELQALEEAPLAVINMKESTKAVQDWEALFQILHRSSSRTSSTTFQRHNGVDLVPREAVKRSSTVTTEVSIKNSIVSTATNRVGHRSSTSQSMISRISAIDLVIPTYPRLVAAVDDWSSLPLHLRSNIVCFRDKYEEESTGDTPASLSKCLQSTILRLSMYPSVQTFCKLVQPDDIVRIPVTNLWQVLTGLVLFHAMLVFRANMLRIGYPGIGTIFHYGDDQFLTAINQYLATILEKKQNHSPQRRRTGRTPDYNATLERRIYQQVVLSSYTRHTTGHQEVEFLRRLFSECLQLVSWNSSSTGDGNLASLQSFRVRSRQMSVRENLRPPVELIPSTHSLSMSLTKGLSTLSVVKSSLLLGFLAFPSEALQREDLSMDQWLELLWIYSASIDQHTDSKLQILLLGYQQSGTNRRGPLEGTSRDLFATSDDIEMTKCLVPEWMRSFGWIDENRATVLGDADVAFTILLSDAIEIVRAIVTEALPLRLDPERQEDQAFMAVRTVYNQQIENCSIALGAILTSLQEVAVLVDTPEEQEDFLVEDSEEDEDDNEVVEQQDEGKLLRLTDVKDQHVRQQIVAVLRNEIPPGLFGQGSSPPPPISSTWSLHDAIQHYQDWHKFLTNTTRNVHPSRWWLPGILATGLSLPYILDVTQQNPSSKTPVQFTLRLPPDCDEDDAEPPEYPTAPIPANTFAMINGVVLLGAKWNGSLQSLDQVDDLQRHQRVELVCFVSTDTDSTTTQRVPLLASHDGSLLLECALPVDPNGLSPLATPFLRAGGFGLGVHDPSVVSLRRGDSFSRSLNTNFVSRKKAVGDAKEGDTMVVGEVGAD